MTARGLLCLRDFPRLTVQVEALRDQSLGFKACGSWISRRFHREVTCATEFLLQSSGFALGFRAW